MILGNIIQENTHLFTDNQQFVCQWGENVSLSVSMDSTFDGYSFTWLVAYDRKMMKTDYLAYDAESHVLTIPSKALKKAGHIYITLRAMKGDVTIPCSPVSFLIIPSGNPNADNSPCAPEWEEVAKELFKQIFSNEYKRPLDELFEKNEVLQDDIAKTEEVVNNTLSAVNEAIEQSSAAAQNANTATSAASDAAQAASSAANRANDAASDASSAAQNANDIASEVERKLQAGEFIGETGPVGPKGEDGTTGPTGPKGDPGSRILYGSGAPSSSIGNIGDWYYDTGSELWDVYYKSSAAQWTKMGQLKSESPAPNPNLIINGDFQVWQRGTTVDAGKRSGFAPDRWYMSRNESVRLKTTIKKNDGNGGLCVTFTSAPASGENVQFDYFVPQETAKEIAGKTVTLSYAGTGDIKVRVRIKNGDNYSDVVAITDDTAVTLEAPVCGENDILDIVVYTYSTATVHYVKLEPGGVATTNVPRYYSEELMECMRFYQRLTYSYSTYCSSLSTSMHDTLFLKMPMRTAPTITSITSVPNNDSINVRSISYGYLPGGTLRFSVEPSATGFVRIYNVTIELEAELI